MKRAFLLGIATVAAATALAIGFAAARAHHFLPVGEAMAARGAATPPKKGQNGPANPSGNNRVIRFASNPTDLPPFLVNDLDGNVISTADFGGKVVLLNFWATWCPPCRDEIPGMIELANRYKDRLEIIGVSMDTDPPDEVRAFAQQMGINYPVVMGGRTISDEYGGIPVLPTSFVVNTEGRVVQKHAGLFPISMYEGEIRALLGLPVDAKIETFKDNGQIFLKNATEFPGVSFAGLTAAQKQAVLKRMNSEVCDCGCGLTIAQCRISDASCTTSQKLAANIVRQIRTSRAKSSTAPAARQ